MKGSDLLRRAAGIVMTLTAYPLLGLWTLLCIVFFPPAFLAWRLVTGWDGGRIMRHVIWVYGHGWLAIMSPFVRFRREGFDNLSGIPPSIIVLNHLSFFDTYCMALLPFHDVTFAVRAWPFRMFWYGAFMRLAGYLNVEGSSWEEIRNNSARVLAAGGHLLFFPEGHRSRDGELQQFGGGAFRLAVETGAPLIPLCITGTWRLLPPGRFQLTPSRVTLRALPAIDSGRFGGKNGHRALMRRVRMQMQEALEQMDGNQK
ncbi:MAG: 1-acyl-sn-glycerol-3-phosphate acyltransferase [Desulfuromonadaceae bacterium]|nr:1-acyl-sn-glycerol-3-phosphate acyltransferase [Desulfuromonadaceae bacterium]